MACVHCAALVVLCYVSVHAAHPTCAKTSSKDTSFDCSKSGCCQDPSKTCYLKDHTWGECLDDCKKGKHASDPKKFRTAWSCAQVASSGTKLVVKEYGQCGGMLAGQGEKKYDGPTECESGCHCAKQSMWISICQPKVAGRACGAHHLRIGKHTVSAEFSVNERVEAMFAGLWYGAKIDEINEDGTYKVAWATDNFLTSTTVSKKQLRHRIGEKKDSDDEDEDEQEEKADDVDDIDEAPQDIRRFSSDDVAISDSEQSTRLPLVSHGVVMFAAVLLVSGFAALVIKIRRSHYLPIIHGAYLREHEDKQASVLE